jgi:steroid 5-alpha reductase family enzyme
MNFLIALSVILILMVILWLISIPIKNVSIVDAFWGMGFVVVNATYFILEPLIFTRNIIVLLLVSIWGIRLSAYLFKRNYGKPEDFRYQEFRQHYGENRYWWFSFFQVFILQGSLIMIVSLPLFGIHGETTSNELNIIDYIALLCWCIGFLFESVGDYQLTKFKKNPANKGKILKTGLWRYTRHPNYFGDATVWFSFGLFSIASGGYWHIIGAFAMIYLIIKISGVALLEKTLNKTKPGYKEYIESTNAFIPWFPKKK